MNEQILRYYIARTVQIGGNYRIFQPALVALWGNYKVLGQNVITSYFRICSVRHYKAYWTINFLQYNTWIFLFLFSNKVLDPIWKVYGLGFSKKSLDCENAWFSKTGILNPTLSGMWNGAGYLGGGHYDPPPWNQPEWSYRVMWGVKLGVLGYAQFI